MDNVLVREVRRLSGSARFHFAEKGPGGLAAETGDYMWSYLSYPFLRRKWESEPLTVFDRQVPYIRHHYNRAWRNERSVELALALDFLGATTGERTLEIGNVMSHYGPADYDILDKYESSPGVINEDIVDFAPTEPYDRVLSISTLEHVGWDERPRDPEKVLRAYRNVRSLLRPGGVMLVTTPLGQNPHLDEYIQDGLLDFPVQVFLKRVSSDNRWEAVDKADVAGSRYHDPYRNANGLFVGIVPAENGWPYTSPGG